MVEAGFFVLKKEKDWHMNSADKASKELKMEFMFDDEYDQVIDSICLCFQR